MYLTPLCGRPCALSATGAAGGRRSCCRVRRPPCRASVDDGDRRRPTTSSAAVIACRGARRRPPPIPSVPSGAWRRPRHINVECGGRRGVRVHDGGRGRPTARWCAVSGCSCGWRLPPPDLGVPGDARRRPPTTTLRPPAALADRFRRWRPPPTKHQLGCRRSVWRCSVAAVAKHQRAPWRLVAAAEH